MSSTANSHSTLRGPFYRYAVTDKRTGDFLREFFSSSCDHYGLWYVETQFDPKTENITEAYISAECCFSGADMTIVWASPFGPALPFGRGQEKATEPLTQKLLPRPLIVTGPGRYRMRNGREAVITEIKGESTWNAHNCHGTHPARKQKTKWIHEWHVWGSDGRAIGFTHDPRDLLEKLSD